MLQITCFYYLNKFHTKYFGKTFYKHEVHTVTVKITVTN